MTRILWTRLVAGLGLFGLAVSLVVLGPPRQEAAAADARAATDSAVTVNGRPGQYEDFSDLAITVSQTKGLVSQGIEITWTGGNPTPYGAFGPNYLSFMQCWGPDPDAPDFRETCQFGAGLEAPWPSRSGNATREPAKLWDPAETFEPLPGVPGYPAITSLPFRAANGRTYVDTGTDASDRRPHPVPEEYDGLIRDVFNVGSTNEQPWVATGGDGGGRTIFWVQTAKEAPHLGCGRVTEESPEPQPCWLVIVPRGAFTPTGDPRQPDVGGGDPPISLTNWANRIVVELDFQPVSGFCELGAQEQSTVGTELIAEAMTSWQPVLCADGGPTFGFSATGDVEAANQLLSTYEGAPGLAFTIDPIRPEREGQGVVHAPVALSGLTISYLIDFRPKTFAPPEVEALFGTQVDDLKLTPRLVAKLLTQSYQVDVPGGGAGGLEHLSSGEGVQNPIYITYDPEFLELNPAFKDFPPTASGPLGLMVTLPNAAVNRELWRWIQADPAAREWLAGTPDENGMIVNPNYENLGLDETAPLNFPKADPECARPPNAPEDQQYCTLDLRPYVGSYAEIAQRVLRADVGEKAVWDQYRDPPGYVVASPRPVGKRWTVGVTDTASAARYGVYTASLRNAAGEFVQPTEESMLAAANAMEDGNEDGVFEIDPAEEVPGAYPLTMVTYAAVRVDQAPAALLNYAGFLAYAATDGQEPGSARGQLPPGYVTMPDELRATTAVIALFLAALAEPTPSPTPTPTSTPTPTPTGPGLGDPGPDPAGAGDDPPPGSDGNGPPVLGHTPPPDDTGSTSSPSPGPTPPPPNPSPTPTPTESSTPVAQATSTPGTDAGIAPYVLMVALLLGAAAAIAGPALAKLGSRFSRPA
ncbi:hypothetical protein [Jiangella ureilytica]|uniref:hypothetical protein n=1 Tax=Jiangella ureilytica TaxID=2530374 RepID=UPI0013A5D856|nr:hypothetical protein [Jiangella ureilytica]